MESTILIDGFGPLPLVRPGSVAELGDIVRRAVAENSALYPVGGGTMLGLGNGPTKSGVAVDLRSLNQVIDFPARDMTITVQAGITIAELQKILAQENLRLPIDVPQADRATLGGILATNTSGPRRYGYGTLRDYVIGISAVNDEGNEFKAGGRVVKNVAGYDLCKLLIGSLGTLGIITQATLKLRPLAEEQALVTIGCEGDQLDSFLNELHASRTRPICLELLNQRAAEKVFAHAKLPPPSLPWTIIVGYEGNEAAVHWQVQELVKEVGRRDALEARLGYTAEPLWTALIQQVASKDANLSIKVCLPSHLTGSCGIHLDRLYQCTIQSHAGSGSIHAHFDAKESEDWEGNTYVPEKTAKHLVDSLRTFVEKCTDAVVVVRCDPAWKTYFQVWGPPPPAAWLMHEVKKQFDPRRIFNPGRFVDGI